MAEEELSTYEEFLAKLRQYKSYDAAIKLIKEEQESKLFGLGSCLKRYIIEKEVLKGMTFSVHGENSELKLRGGQMKKDDMGIIVDKDLPYRFSAVLMGFERTNDKYVHAEIRFDRFSTTIELPIDITRDELKKLRDKYEFVIDVKYLSETVRKVLRNIEKIDAKIKRFTV